MQQIISASRRTDIPAFYSDWLLNRLAEGFAEVRHPFTGKWSRVSLKPEDVGAIVFWSKNYAPLLPKLDTVGKTTKNLFFHFTITANRDLELRTPDPREAIRDYIHIAKRYSPDHIIWRFDPICITDKLSFEIHEERFSLCAELLKGHTASCIISFAHPYRKMLANLSKYTSHALVSVTKEEEKAYADRLAKRAAGYGIRLLACCNDHILSHQLGKARCIDGLKFSLLFGMALDTRSAASRKECGCTKSIDIGAYDTCGHGCIYCYANTDQEKAGKAASAIDPANPALHPKYSHSG
ncbi:MAG TPA: DUF1848 domain-containing protein [Nitrospirota bacterium]|nr:DUF1848 domain-containing protein [Nitrospirota bacterium]